MNKTEKRIESFFESIRNKPILFVVILIILNATFKFFQLSLSSIWLDEAHTATQSLKNIHEIISDSSKDQNPPLYFIIMHFWVKIFGISEYGIRSFSALLSTITAVLIFLFAKEKLNIRTAVIASLLFTFSEQQIYFAEEARAFALVGMLCIFSFYIFLRLIEGPSISLAVMLGVINVLLIYSHFISCFIIAVQFLFLVIKIPAIGRMVMKYFAGSMFITVILFVPWISSLFSNLPKPGEYWLSSPTFYNLKGLFISFSNGKIVTMLFAVLIFVSMIIFARQSFRSGHLQKREYNIIFLLLWFLFPVIADYIVSSITPVFLNKYLLYTSIGLYLLVGYCLSELKISEALRMLITLLLLILFTINAKIKVSKSEDWRTTAQYVRSLQEKGTITILNSACTYMPFSYYYNQSVFSDYKNTFDLLAVRKIFPLDELKDTSILDLQNQVILVQSHPGNQLSEFFPMKVLRRKFNLVAQKKFGDIDIFLFQRTLNNQ